MHISYICQRKYGSFDGFYDRNKNLQLFNILFYIYLFIYKKFRLIFFFIYFNILSCQISHCRLFFQIFLKLYLLQNINKLINNVFFVIIYDLFPTFNQFNIILVYNIIYLSIKKRKNLTYFTMLLNTMV